MPELIESLYKLQKKDIPLAGEVLSDAFEYDLIWEKVFTNESKDRKKRNACFEIPVRYCLKYGEVFAPSENLEGIAAWIPGNLADMTFPRIIRSGSLGSTLKMGARVAAKMKPAFMPIQRDRNEYMKEKSYIYLQIIGVALKSQGSGFGGRLLRALIEKSEKTGHPIYLETETEENVAMYEHFGFVMVQQIVVPVLDLPMWEMIRNPAV
jgi:ribosomal protein S18 acetylase RimI-like enzyme